MKYSACTEDHGNMAWYVRRATKSKPAPERTIRNTIDSRSASGLIHMIEQRHMYPVFAVLFFFFKTHFLKDFADVHIRGSYRLSFLVRGYPVGALGEGGN